MLRRNVYLSCWGVLSIACLGMLLTACAPAAGEGWVDHLPRPEDAARAHAGCPSAAVHVHAVHDFPNGDRLLLYSGTCAPIPEQPWPKPVRGFVMFEPKNGAFRPSGTAEIDNQAPIPHDAFLEYVSGGVTTPTAVYTYAYGRVLSPEVATVEALIDTGAVVRATISDGRYGVIAAAQKGICAVRIRGMDGQVLTTTMLAVADSGTGVPRAKIRPGGIDAWSGAQAEPARCATLHWVDQGSHEWKRPWLTCGLSTMAWRPWRVLAGIMSSGAVSHSRLARRQQCPALLRFGLLYDRTITWFAGSLRLLDAVFARS